MKKILQGLSGLLLMGTLVAMPLSIVASEGVDTEMMPSDEELAQMSMMIEAQLATFPEDKQAELRAKLDTIDTLSSEEQEALFNEIFGGLGSMASEEVEIDVEEPAEDSE